MTRGVWLDRVSVVISANANMPQRITVDMQSPMLQTSVLQRQHVCALRCSNTLEDPLGGDGKAQGALNVVYTLYLVSVMRHLDKVVPWQPQTWFAPVLLNHIVLMAIITESTQILHRKDLSSRYCP